MILRKCAPVCLFIIILATPLTAYSKETSLRCGTSLVSIGDSKSRVFFHCGEPYLREVIGYSELPGSEDEIDFIVESWTYDIGQSHFYIITFLGGRVENIESEKKW
jgi:hypothetical protein